MVTATRLKELIGNSTEAYGANPSDLDKIYEFKYKVIDLNDVVPSHTDTLTPNPDYPQELQPRLRDRAASKAQIDGMAKNLNPRVLLTDSGFLDTGPMIVGKDNVVESGNGRMLALRKAAKENMSRYQLYKNMLIGNAEKYGISPDKIEGVNFPVLVRERVTNVDRVEFAREANQGAVLGMSPFEQALVDSKRLSDNIINTMQVGDDQTIDQALKARANDHIVGHFLQTVPANERATLADSKGSINQQGLQRLKMAIFAKTYPGESGQRLTRTFSESVDPLIKNIENGMFQSLPDMAKAESLIATGKREDKLSISQDLAEAIDTYARLKQTEIKVGDYLKQSHMFGGELTPFQKQILEHLDTIGQRPKLIRELLRESAEKIVNAPAKGQTGMLGGYEAPSKEEMINGIINRQRTELGKESLPVATTQAASKRLEKPDTRGDRIPKELGQKISETIEPVKPDEPTLAAHTSVQTGLMGFETKPAQMQAFAEFSGGGKKETLVDVAKLKEQEAAKPLPGQIDFITGKTVEGKDVPKPVPKPQEAQKSKEQNFTQFAISRGYPSDYDILDHGTLSPSGHVSKRARKQAQDSQAERARQNEIAHEEYKQAILAGEVIDPSGEVTKEKILANKQWYADKEKQGRILQLESGIEQIEGLGRMSHLPSGKLKVGYQRTVDIYQKELDELKGTTKPAPAPAKVEAKVEKVAKGKPVTVPSLEELRAIHADRKPQSIARDNSAKHKITIEHTNPAVKRWVKDPGSKDIIGVDAPPSVTKPTVKPRVRIVNVPPEPVIKKKFNKPKSKKFKQTKNDIDLGAGVVQNRKRRHIRLT